MRIGITEKVNALSLLIIFLFAALLSIFSVQYQNKILDYEMTERANALISVLKNQCEYPALIRDVDTLHKVAANMLQQKDIVFCSIEDKSGKILASEAKPYHSTINAYQGAIVTLVKNANPEEIMFGVPVDAGKQEVIGKVSLYISLASINSKKQEITQKIVLTAMLLMIVIFILSSILLSFVLKKPIDTLILATKRIAAGELDHHVSVNSRDEIGNLATSFNKMVDELKLSREKLEVYSATLEERNKDLENANESLRQMQVDLVRSEKLAAIGRLASGVGHELRNPLAGISNIAFFLKRYVKSDQPKVNEFLDILVKEVKTANKIVTDLLDYSRVKKLNIVNDISIEDIIDESIADSHLAETVTIVKNYNASYKHVPVDPDKIKQVFNNILTNAAQAMDEKGSICITTVDEGNNDSGHVSIHFKDTGPGMKPDTMKHIFEPLFTTKTKGIGLGLAITKEIVERHNGLITVDSTEGVGTVFTVSLPLKADIHE